MLEYMLGRKDWLVLDLETTGLDPNKHEITEIGVITSQGGEYSWRIMPEHLETSDPYALYINGFDYQEWVEKSIPAKQVIFELNNLLLHRSIIGTNPAFDISFLVKLYDKYNADTNVLFKPKPVCISNLAIPAMLLTDSQCDKVPSLYEICKFLNVSYDNAHTALRDCEITKECFIKLVDFYRENYS